MNLIDFEIITKYPALNDPEILPYLLESIKLSPDALQALSTVFSTLTSRSDYQGHYAPNVYRNRDSKNLRLTVNLKSPVFIVLSPSTLEIGDYVSFETFSADNLDQIKNHLAGLPTARHAQGAPS